MSTDRPGSSGLEQDGFSLASSLRDYLVSGVIVVDTKKGTASVSAEAAQILALDTELPVLPLDRLPVEIANLVRDASGAAAGAMAAELELRPPGHRPCSIKVSTLAPPSGRKAGVAVLLLNNVTATRQIEDRIWQLDRLANLGLLAADIAHEIKNALVAQKTFLDLVLEKNQDSELVDVVRREMVRIEELVARVLRFSKPSSPATGEIHLHEVVEHSLRLVQSQLLSKSIVLHRAFRAASDLANGDDYKLEQAVVNVLLNAVQAMGPHGVLKVGTELVPAHPGTSALHDSVRVPRLRLTIEDSGEGITPENLRRIFQPFFTTKPAGTGLGLAITHRIIEEHRGVITVESRPGKGTTFTILLPAAHTRP
jgi:signal transduction histidine kinase